MGSTEYIVPVQDKMEKIFAVLLISLAASVLGIPARSKENNLDLIKLEDYPLAQCNDGTTAVYYRKPMNSNEDTKKLLIWLKGGGFCVPFLPGHDCKGRCKDKNATFPLCTAATEPHFDLDTHMHNTIFSPDPVKNPAFFDYNFAYVPYCSSDCYTGRKNASWVTDNYIFHGHYIVEAIIDDLIKNTWITEAEEVVLMGSSAGGIGTDANCDRVADTLHSINPDILIKCIADSGSIYPLNTHTEGCYPKLFLYDALLAWNGVTDESCMAETEHSNCISATTAWPYLETPMLTLHSSTDTTIRFCYEDNPEFWQSWKDELGDIGREIAAARPDLGMFLLNCPFHGAVGNYYSNAEVSTMDSDNPDDQMFLRDILYNFMKGIHPYQAIDDMTVKNPNCKH